MGLDELLTEVGADGRVVHVERLPARPARHGRLAEPLPAPAARCLPPEGLWWHQARAIDLVRSGRSVAVATGTASGKSLCYQLPIVEAVTSDPAGTALLLFPTKALAQNQLAALGAFEVPGLAAATYDGDTLPEHRVRVRRNANVVLTNPDMLHVGILPHHGRWAGFLARLRYVVVDELHTLRGIFGTHVAHLLRRLRRICANYGSDPTFVFSSATIGGPGALAEALCADPVTEITDDGSPRGERVVALWNPPLLDPERGERASPNGEAAGLVASLVGAGHRTIAFCRSRKATEVVFADSQRRLGPGGAERVRPYRGGYLAHERREIEAALFSGRLDGVVATSALELGIDVGGLDACVSCGFPATVASFWQQTGRAGRGTSQSLAVLVAGQDQLDQWLVANPGELFSRPPEPAVVNPRNPDVLVPHLACAAHELPLTHADERWWGDDLEEGVRVLVLDDKVRVRNGRGAWCGGASPAWSVGLRTGSSREYRIVGPEGRVVGTVDEHRAFEQVHPGATYLHQGESFHVTDLDLDERIAVVEPSDGEVATQPRSETDVRLLGVDDAAPVGRATLFLGPVEVHGRITGYERRDLRTGESLGVVDLDLPPTVLRTRAFWYVVDDDTVGDAGVQPDQLPGALHATEHAGIGILPLFAICDRWDVGGVSTPRQTDTGCPTIVVYDGYPGGAGIAELGFRAGREHLEAAADVIDACPCTAGCPGCVQSPKCGNGNEPLDKAAALDLLRAILA